MYRTDSYIKDCCGVLTVEMGAEETGVVMMEGVPAGGLTEVSPDEEQEAIVATITKKLAVIAVVFIPLYLYLLTVH